MHKFFAQTTLSKLCKLPQNMHRMQEMKCVFSKFSEREMPPDLSREEGRLWFPLTHTASYWNLPFSVPGYGPDVMLESLVSKT